MREIDKINSLSEEEITDIDFYFDKMELTDEERENRKEFSESMMDIMLFIFSLFSVMGKYNYINKSFIVGQLRERYSEVVLKYIDIDKAINDYIEKFSEEIVNTTIKYTDEEYYLSKDRAAIVSVNEANSILGYRQLQVAKEKGYTRKTWITERDEKVRKTHRKVDGETINIDRLFLVGNSLMAYPHDFSAEPEEVCGCRCSIKYS